LGDEDSGASGQQDFVARGNLDGFNLAGKDAFFGTHEKERNEEFRMWKVGARKRTVRAESLVASGSPDSLLVL
jgi:hypothetical protein